MKILLFFVLAIVLSAAFANAEILLNISVKPSFSIGEAILFNYSIDSDEKIDVVYSVSVRCPEENIIATPIEKSVSLTPKRPYTDTYDFFTVSDETKSQTCTAYLYITNPEYVSTSKNLTIDANPIPNFDILLCKDEICEQRSNSFKQGETIYLQLDSKGDLSAYQAKAQLTGPENKNLGIKDSKSEFFLSSEGEYALNVTLLQDLDSRSVQKTFFTRSSEQFQLEKKINTENICNQNNKCEKSRGETQQNCAFDCNKKESNPSSFLLIFFLISLVGALAVVAIILITKKIKNKPKRI